MTIAIVQSVIVLVSVIVGYALGKPPTGSSEDRVFPPTPTPSGPGKP